MFYQLTSFDLDVDVTLLRYLKSIYRYYTTGGNIVVQCIAYNAHLDQDDSFQLKESVSTDIED